MENFTINSVKDFISILDERNIKPDIDFFRGHSDINYKLIPSIGRLFPKDLKRTKDFEQDMMSEFRRMHTLHVDRCNNEFELLFLAQHHGLPTRLLDWSYNPLVALYFAVCSNYDKDGCVYQYFPSRMIFVDNRDPYTIESNFLIKPIITNERYKNQNSVFIIYANPTEEESDIYAKYRIQAAYKKHILMSLRKIGISHSFIYPTLEGLCKDIKLTKLNLWEL